MILDVAVVGSVLPAPPSPPRWLAAEPRLPSSMPRTREKPCGGGFTGRALSLVAEPVAGTSLSGVDIRTVRFLDTPGGKHALVDLDARHRLVVASRP